MVHRVRSSTDAFTDAISSIQGPAKATRVRIECEVGQQVHCKVFCFLLGSTGYQILMFGDILSRLESAIVDSRPRSLLYRLPCHVKWFESEPSKLSAKRER